MDLKLSYHIKRCMKCWFRVTRINVWHYLTIYLKVVNTALWIKFKSILTVVDHILNTDVRVLEKRTPNQILIAKIKPDGLAKANLILIKITTKDKVVVACIDELNSNIWEHFFNLTKLFIEMKIVSFFLYCLFLV